MYREFYLDGSVAVEEPRGFENLLLSLSRDAEWHGVFAEASVNALEFLDPVAMAYLKEKKKNEGMKAVVTFTALQSCEDSGVYDELEELITGKLDFESFEEVCGIECFVSITLEETNCVVSLRNLYGHKVDMESTVAFDKITALQQYTKLGEEITLKARALEALVKGAVATLGDIISNQIFNINNGYTVLMFRPTYAAEEKNSIATGQLIPNNPEGWLAVNLLNDTAQTFLDISPQLLFEDNINCYAGAPLSYSFRLKGSFNIKTDEHVDEITLKVVTWNAQDDIYHGATILHSFTISSGVNPGVGAGFSASFDQTFSGTLSPEYGIGLYAFLEFTIAANNPPTTFEISLTFTKESNVDISTVKECPDTTAKVYAVNEALSHVVEAITNSCIRVKSDYYGRYDSQPYTSEVDGCGSLRVLSPGIAIRKAEQFSYFESLESLFKGLNPIDNIGMGLETNPFLPNSEWLRIEQMEYFYRDEECIRLPNVPEVRFRTTKNKYFSLIHVGYEKWEAEVVNGLDEFNSKREYRTGLNSVNNTLQIVSRFVAGGIPLEKTRQQSFATSGGADTKFDNDTFIICVERDGYGVFQVEQGNILSAANFFSPQTAYNWRIRPFSNLQRWFKSIANSYASIDDSTSKLYFVSGVGNYLAVGELAIGAYDAAGCKPENGPKAENADMSKHDFANMEDYLPVIRPDEAAFNYSISIKEYNQIKARKNGYVSFQCGNGAFHKGYINKLEYNVGGANQSNASFTLQLKWE